MNRTSSATAASSNGRTPLEDAFRSHLTQSGLIGAGDRVVVAFSGGLDSVTLLHLLRFHPPFPLRVRAAHFDHAMRPGSALDASWAAGLCNAWQVRFTMARADPVPRSEAAARDMRYQFLAEAAAQSASDCIASAHHADDQAETVLFRLLRGTGLHGLAAIPERRGRLVRPLLPFRRSALLAYATAAGLRWREDPTNVSLDFARNRIRHVLLPTLERSRAGITDQLASLARDARVAEHAWRPLELRLLQHALVRHDEAGLELARGVMLRYHPFVRARVLRAALLRLGPPPDRAGTHAALTFISSGAGGGVIELAGGVRIEREFDRLVLRRGSLPAPAADRPLPIHSPGEGAGVAVIGGRRVTMRWSRNRSDDGGHSANFDPAGLVFPLVLRGWRPGDRIRLDYGSKKLKKLFAERRIARGTRPRIPVLADGQGRIIWVVGVTRGADAIPAPDVPRFYITVTDAEHG